MKREEIEKLLHKYNDDVISDSLRGRVKFQLDAYDDLYIMFSLFIDDDIYKFFSYEEVVEYDHSRFIYDVMVSLQSRYERAISVPIEKRDVYSGWELLFALENYIKTDGLDNIDLTNPLSFMLYILDNRTDISVIEEKNITHKWLVDIYHLRLTGSMPKEFYERKTVILDFASCNDFGDMYREMRTKMKWSLYYGESLDALWDILTGMYYYGDDFVIRRKEVHQFTEYGRVIDYTNKVDKICELFEEASKSIYSDITVKIEYVD